MPALHASRPETVTIIGQAPRAFPDAADSEVWVVNGPWLPERWDILWQLHGPEHIRRRHGRRFVRSLQDIEAPRRLFMTARHDDIPAAEAFPIGWLTNRAGRYFTGSIPIMIAYAVEVGAVRITLDGMRFRPGTTGHWASGEGWMVPCVEYHLGRARARGVHVDVNAGSGLFAHDDFVYGFEGPGAV